MYLSSKNFLCFSVKFFFSMKGKLSLVLVISFSFEKQTILCQINVGSGDHQKTFLKTPVSQVESVSWGPTL